MLSPPTNCYIHPLALYRANGQVKMSDIGESQLHVTVAIVTSTVQCVSLLLFRFKVCG